MRRRLLLALALLLLLAAPAWAQITRDTQADLGNNGGATSTLTVSYTMGAVSNGLLTVGFDGDNIGSADDCAGGGGSFSFPTPIKVDTVGNGLFAANVTTGSSTKISCSGFISTVSY